MTIIIIALIVLALALLVRRVQRQIKRTQRNKLYVSEAYRRYLLGRPERCDEDEVRRRGQS